MKSITTPSSRLFGLIIAVFAASGLLLGVLSTTDISRAESKKPVHEGQRLITIHDDGAERSILTEKNTLRDAFAEAKIRIDTTDRVEPSLDEKLTSAIYEANVYRARPVTIVDGAIQQRVMSAYRTPKQIAKQAGIVLQDEDIATLQLQTDMVAHGMGVRVAVDRATPFTFILYGKKLQSYSQEKTVGAMLKTKKITVGADDTLSVAPTATLASGMTIELWRNGKNVITEDQDVPFTIEKIKDADHEVGYKQVKTPGVIGKKSVTFEIEMKNGVEIGRKEINTLVTKQPENQVEIVGAKITNTFSGSFAEALARLRSCEGSYTTNTGNGYYGAYQYDRSTWANYAGYAVASDAPPAVQDQKAWETYQRRGWQPWPSCSRSQGLQDIYR